MVHSPRTALLVVLLTVLASPIASLSADRPLVISQKWVAEQITKLDADTLGERNTAERTLLEAGADVLPFLPGPELLPNAGVRQAVRRIRLRLEEAKARASVKASTVTLEGTLPLKEALRVISVQTGNEFDTSQLPAETLEANGGFTLQGGSFWESMDSLGQTFGFDWESPKATNPSGQALRLVSLKKKKEGLQRRMDQAFLIEMDTLKLRPRFGVEDQQLLRVPIRLAAEPRLRPLFLKVEGQDFSAHAGKKTYSSLNPEAKLELPLGEAGTEISFNMDFEVPKPLEEKRVDLSGKATLTVAAGSEEFRFSDLTKDAGAAKRRGGVTVTLNEVDFQPDQKNADRKTARFRITVHYDTGGPAFESHRTWMFHNQVYLEDAKGQKLERGGDFQTVLQTDGGVSVEYNFENLTGEVGDYKFVYVAPTLIINVPVSFEFHSLPVPK